MTREEAIQRASEIRRASTYNPRTRSLKAYGKSVDSIPCYRCGGTKLVKLGNDAFAGFGPCQQCNRKGFLTPADIERTILLNRTREQQALNDLDTDMFNKFDKLKDQASTSLKQEAAKGTDDKGVQNRQAA